jgi:hypothetical protein
MARLNQRNFWRRLRRVVRWCRIAGWLAVLALVALFIYLNTVGLPGFLRTLLLEELRRRGVPLTCSRLYWNWYRGVVAEDVTFGAREDPRAPRASAQQAAIRPSLRALLRGAVEVRSVLVRGGEFQLRLPGTNAPPVQFSLSAIQCELRLLPGDEWQLDRFQASYGDAALHLTGTISNASAFQTWAAPTLPPGQKFDTNKPAGAELAEQLRNFTETYRKIQFAGQPDLTLMLRGDARDWRQFTGLLTVRAPGADTPWGSITNFQLVARLRPALQPHTLPFGKLTLEAKAARTRWARTEDLRLELNCPATEGPADCIQTEVVLSAGRTVTEWARAAGATGSFRLLHSLTNPVPLQASGEIALSRPSSRWGRAESAQLRGEFRLANPAVRTDESWAWWAKLAPYHFAWQADFTAPSGQGLVARRLSCGGSWRAPELLVTNLHANLYGGAVTADASLNVADRATSLRWRSDFDLFALAPVLPEFVLAWRERLAYSQPPGLRLEASARLPAWTNAGPAYLQELLPSLAANGDFQIGPATFQGVAVTAAKGAAVYASQRLQRATLHVARPEGSAEVTQTTDAGSGQIQVRVQSGLDPKLAQPFVDAGTRQVLDLLGFSTPPQVDAQLWLGPDGVFRGVAGSVLISNVTFRGESIVRVSTALQVTNRIVEFYHPEAVLTHGTARADGLRLDLAAQKLHITNGFSTMDPMILGRAVGDPGFLEILGDYHFLVPPTAQVWGTVALAGVPGFDLHVDVEGGPFRWWRIDSPRLRGQLSYVDSIVTITNVRAAYGDGQLDFNARFDVAPRPAGAAFRFDTVLTNVNLQALMHGLFQSTNQLEGLLGGELHVTDARTLDWDSWQGYGHLSLADGMVWQMPVFSVFSTILNKLAPGLGSVRFKSGTASFTITNSLIHSRDLEMNALLLRMKCKGTVDFPGRVDAAVQAAMSRNMGVFGPILSTVFWPFSKALEYKVTGTLDQPQAEPLHDVTKLLLLPLTPLEAVTGIFTGTPGKTNAPAPPPPP